MKELDKKWTLVTAGKNSLADVHGNINLQFKTKCKSLLIIYKKWAPVYNVTKNTEKYSSYAVKQKKYGMTVVLQE